MGRRERPLDPEAGPVQRFAYDLRKLRQEAGGATYRAMAQRTEYSVATLSRAAAGEQLPSLAVVLAYARACEADPQEWEQRWRVAAAEVVAEPGTDDDAHAPYRGLARFEPDDAALFFGREDLVAQLAERVHTHRLVALVGASGSGKSSLLRAGLIPQLRAPSERGPQSAAIRVITPGEHPLRNHAQRLVPAETDADTVLIVDQFEELYTLSTPPRERNQFIDQLLTATDPASRLRVIIAVRADFLGRCAEHHPLAAALREATVLAGSMSPAELREAIVKPAAAAGLIIERALTAKIIEDVTDKPGGLPLMSHALLETWRRRKGRNLTLTAYNAAGGVAGAITQTAEDLYTRLPSDQAACARRILLRLISPGDGREDTRRPVPAGELATETSSTTAEVLERLAKTRLVTLEDSTVHLAHEALIAAWPRLRAWIDESRERLRLHRQLTEAARTWADLDRDPGALYRGTRLTTAEEIFAAPDKTADLTPLERDFLIAGSAARQREQQLAARTTRRLRRLAVTLSAMLALALIISLTAWYQYKNSEQQRNRAVTAQRMALSRQFAAQSTNLLGENSDLASLLAVQAYQTYPTGEATSSLYAAAALPLRRRLAGEDDVRSVAFSPNGRTLAVADTRGSVRLWDVISGRVRATADGDWHVVESVAFSPDGRTLAIAGGGSVQLWNVTADSVRTVLTGRYYENSLEFSPDGSLLAVGSGGVTNGSVRIWDVTTDRLRANMIVKDSVRSVAFSPDGRLLAVGSGGSVALRNMKTGKTDINLTGAAGVESVAFSPDGHTLACGSDDGKVRLWNTGERKARATLTGAAGVESVAFSPDGHTLASGSDDGMVRLWNTAKGKVRARLRGHARGVAAVTFSPDGRTLASGSDDHTARIWNLPARQVRATLKAHAGGVESVAFSPDGRTLASGSDDHTIRLWDAAKGTARTTLTGAGSVESVAYSPNGRTLASGSVDGSVRLWNIPANKMRTTLTNGASVDSAVAFSPDGRTLATGTDGTRDDTRLQLWDVATGKVRATRNGHTDGVWSVAFNPSGRTLAASGGDGSLRLWNMTTGHIRTTLIGAASMWSVAFSPNGHTLAVGGDDGAIRLWDVAAGKARATLTGHASGVESVAFSPDGRTLASGSDDHTIRLWDAATGKVRATLTGHASGVESVAFSPDGRTLASGSDDHTIRLWTVSLPGPAQAIDTICHAVRREITRQESSLYLQGRQLHPACRR